MAFCGFNLSNNNSLIKLSMNQNLSLSNLFNIFIRPESDHCPDVHPCLFVEDSNAKTFDFVDNQDEGIITS